MAPGDYPRLTLLASSSTLSFGLFLLDELVSYSVQSSGGTDEGRKAERESGREKRREGKERSKEGHLRRGRFHPALRRLPQEEGLPAFLFWECQ